MQTQDGYLKTMVMASNKPFKGEVNEFPQVQILRQKANRKKIYYLKAVFIKFFFICLVPFRSYKDL